MQIEELNASERDWLQAHLQLAQTLVETFAAPLARNALSPEGVDAAWNAWIASPDADPELANSIVIAVGAAFGQFLVDRTGFRWVVASDPQGSEMALVADEGGADAVVYPLNLVAKRYETKQRDFLLPLLEGIEREISRAIRQ